MSDEVECSCCGKAHPINQMQMGFALPDEVFALTPQQRRSRCHLSTERVVLDDTRFFIRGLLPLPVHSRAQHYYLGLWAEISKEVFVRLREIWRDPASASEPPMPGVLANRVPFHEDTIGLSITLQMTGANTRPDFTLLPSEHALFAEQAQGIEEIRALQYSHAPAVAQRGAHQIH